jgi:type I restriction enzyme, S subunit
VPVPEDDAQTLLRPLGIEQRFPQKIAAWLDGQLSDLNKILDRAQREISLIQEFRAHLIADVVTGKLDVRALAATLPEFADEQPMDEAIADEELDQPIEDAENEEVAA